MIPRFTRRVNHLRVANPLRIVVVIEHIVSFTFCSSRF